MSPDPLERFLRWSLNRGGTQIVDIEETVKLARRYFFINAFDGLMVAFGIVLGSFIARASHAGVILWALLGSSLAMGFSGFFGAYISETAERKSMLREIEKSMYVDVNGTKLEKQFSHFSLIIAFVDAAAPLVTSLISIVPFILALMGAINVLEASLASISASLILLFILGYYLGKISGENALKYALLTFIMGLAISFIIFLLIGF